MNFKKISILIMTVVVIFGGTHCIAKEPLIRDLGTKVETDKNKIWRVEFNEDVDYNSINNDNMYIIDESDNTKLNLKFIKENNLKVVAIKAPIDGYKLGHTYILEVKQGIKSIKKHTLNKHIKFKFKISDLNKQTVKKQPEKVIINEKKELTNTLTESSIDSLKIISKIVQPGIVGRGVTHQTGFLDFEMKESTIENDQDLNILGKVIKLKKDDTSDKVKFKILDAFKYDANWKFEIGKVVIKEKWASVQYTSLKPILNVDKLATDTNDIKFKQIDKDIADLGAIEQKEICEVSVKGEVKENKEMRLEIKDANHNVELSTININVNIGDDSKMVAEKIYNALKQDTRQMSRMYNISLDKNNSKVILTQKISYDANTTITLS